MYVVLQERPDRLLVQLPNRLVVVAQELHTAPVVSVQAVVKTGSIYEQQHVGAGLSHFLEHLVSGGSTENRTEQENNAILGHIGAAINASTGLDSVRYYINTTSDFSSEAVDLLSDWLQWCRVDQVEFDRERDVIQREFEMGQGDPNRIFWKLTQQARFATHPARHPTIGYLDEFLKITRDQVYDFYKLMYVPNNMVFVVAGDIDKRQVVNQVARLWADSQPGKLPRLSFPEEPAVTEPRQVSPGTADIARVKLRLVWPGTRLGGAGDYALDLLAIILGQGESSRLVRTVRDEQRVANQIEAYNLSFAWGEGFFGIDAELVDAHAGEDEDTLSDDQVIAMAKQLILMQVHRLGTEGITGQELARAKRQVIANVVYSGQTAEAVASRLGRNLVDMGDPDYLDHYAQRITSVTANQVMAAANHFLSPGRMITISLLPAAGEQIQPLRRPVLADGFDGLEQLPVELDNAQLVERIRTMINLRQGESSATVSEPVQQFVMPNGLRLLVGRSTLVPAVAVQMYQAGGLLADEPGLEGLNKCVARMRTRGTTTRSAQQIAQLVDGLGASLATDSGYNSSFTSAVCLKEDLPQVLELFADVVLNPTFPDGQWQIMRPRLLADIDRQSDSWYGQLHRHFRKSYFGDFPWAYMTHGRRQTTEELKAEDLAKYYRQRISAEESVLAVFGDIDPKQVAEQIQALFGRMPRSPMVPFELRLPTEPEPVVRQVHTNKPLSAVQIGFGPGLTRHNKDYAAAQVLTRVLSRFPAGRLDRALRGSGEGLVYAVWCSQMTGLAPGYIGIVFNASPGKTTKALERTAEVVQRIRNELVDEQTLADAKAAVLTREFFSLQSNSQRAKKVALDEIYGLASNESKQFMEQVRQLDAPLLQVIAQTYLRNPVTVVLAHQRLPGDKLEAATQPLKQAVHGP